MAGDIRLLRSSWLLRQHPGTFRLPSRRVLERLDSADSASSALLTLRLLLMVAFTSTQRYGTAHTQ